MSECRELMVIPQVARAVVRANPLRVSDQQVFEIDAGQSIVEIVGPDCAYSVAVFLNGSLIDRDLWPLIVVRHSDELLIHRYPQGKTVGKWIMWIVAIVAAYYGYYGLLISMMANTIMAKLVPPPKLRSGTGGPAGGDSLLSLTGTSNQALQFGPVPVVLGSVFFFPPHAAQPYTEVLGDEEYLHCLLDLGPGIINVGTITVGGTPLESLTDVQYEFGTNPKSFSNDIFEQTLNLEIDNDLDALIIKTMNGTADEASIDFNFIGGLFGVNDKGSITGGHVDVYIAISPTGANTWTPIGSLTGITFSSAQGSLYSTSYVRISSKQKDPFRLGVRFKLPNKTTVYDVAIQRASTGFDAGTQSISQISNMQLSVLRTINFTNPTNTNTNKLAMRFRATTQQQNVIQQIRVQVDQLIPKWDSINGVWTAPEINTNPAWIGYWWATACPAIARLLPISRMYFQDWIDFADYCDREGFTCNMVIDDVQVFQDHLRDILATGRGSLALRDLGYGVVKDEQQTVHVDYFTPSTMKNFVIQKQYPKLPHALKINFVNPEASWQQDQIIVLADGYSYNHGSGPVDCHGVAAPTLPPATLFETLDLKGVTDPRAAWEHGRYHLAAGYYRLAVYSGEIDVQSLRVTRGDLVSVQHPVADFGIGAGRIKSVSADGKTITVDTPMHYVVGHTINCQIRTNNGTAFLQRVLPSDPGATGITDTFTFATSGGVAAPPTSAVDVGDLAMFGEPNNVTKDMVVTMVKTSENLSATLTMVDADARVWNADTGTMPTFVSGITHSPWEEPPPDPTNLVIVSTQRVAPTNDGGVSGGGFANVQVGTSSGRRVLPRYQNYRYEALQ